MVITDRVMNIHFHSHFLRHYLYPCIYFLLIDAHIRLISSHDSV